MSESSSDRRDPCCSWVQSEARPLRPELIPHYVLPPPAAKRGAAPKGGGEVVLRVPNVRQLPAVDLRDEGMVKRIRGVAYSMRTTPQNANRLVDVSG